MYRSLYIKIILIFVMFMITVMAVVGTVLLNSVFSFYTGDFKDQMERCFDGSLREDLTRALSLDEWAAEQKSILKAYSTTLGIDVYRNYYVLDMDGEALEGSNEELGASLERTPNIIAAMTGRDGVKQTPGSDCTDYAVYLSSNNRECIIYIKDTQEEMQSLSWQLFAIILQSVFFGLFIAVILSFFLAKAITGPIQRLTVGAREISDGSFDNAIPVHSHDEIGELTETFNNMGSKLKRTLDEVSGERMKLETVFSYLKDAVIAFRDNGSVLNINRSARELFGEGLTDDFTADSMFIRMNIEYARSYVMSLDSSKSYVVRDVAFGGRVLDINLGYLRYIEDNTAHTGCITVMHDITARYELDKQQREFVANVSHELRTPLTGIRGAAETILITPDMDGEFRESFLNMILEESDRMLRIIGDLLTLTRFDAKQTKWQISDFDIGRSLSRVCEVMRTEATAHGHTINLDVGEELPPINGDRERIEQVLINVIANAIKYTQKNGVIDIRAVAVDEEHINIYVRDNGVGIPKADMDRLFERFYRVEKARTSDTGGTGLGLAIAKEIVDAHGGQISIKSRVGRGTIVTITLPIRSNLSEDEGKNDR